MGQADHERRGERSMADESAEARGAAPPRVLVAGLGYRNLRDFSVGPRSVELLSALEWPDRVDVDDLSFNPIAVVHRFRDMAEPYGRLVLVASARRGGRPPGMVSVYRWDGALPDPEHVQARVAEAVTGVIDLDNLLVVLGQFEALPGEVVVIEVEPGVEDWGEKMTPPVQAGIEEAVRVARRTALADSLVRLPTSPLGGVTVSN